MRGNEKAPSELHIAGTMRTRKRGDLGEDMIGFLDSFKQFGCTPGNDVGLSADVNETDGSTAW